MSVLKDASAAALYGSRASNGVIIITTKRAKSDQASIQYNYENGFDKPTQLPDYMRASRYMELVNELRWNDAGNGANKFINDFHLQKLAFDFKEYFLDTLINISAELQNILTKIRKG
jgi:TonB-dependent SusC/RagA subfamily outer membrane receptor